MCFYFFYFYFLKSQKIRECLNDGTILSNFVIEKKNENVKTERILKCEETK